MSRSSDFAKNTVVLSIGRFVPKLIAIATLPILTKYLTKTDYGTYDLITTLIMLVIPIATLQIQSAAFRFLIDARGDRGACASIITNILTVTLPIAALASVVLTFFFPQHSVAVRVCIALYFFADTVYLTLGQITRGLGNNKMYSIAAIIMSAIDLVCVLLFVWYLKRELLGVLIGLAAANTAAALFLFFRMGLRRYISPSTVSGARIRELLAYSWPMVPNNLSTWALKLSDRLVITGFLGLEANAVYAVANKLPNILNMAQSVMVMAWHESASIAVKDKDARQYYSKMLRRSFDLLFSCTALLIAATPILFRLLIRGDYDEAYYQMPVLILGTFFFVMSSFFGGIYIAHKKTVNVGISTVVAAIINLAIDFALVNVIGIWAGSISTLAAYVVLYYYRMIDSHRFQPVDCDLKRQFIQIAILAGMLYLCFLRNRWLDLVNIALGVAVFILFNRKLIKKVLSKALRRR